MKALKIILEVVSFISLFAFLVCICGIDGVTNWTAYIITLIVIVSVFFGSAKATHEIEWLETKKEREQKRNERNTI